MSEEQHKNWWEEGFDHNYSRYLSRPRMDDVKEFIRAVEEGTITKEHNRLREQFEEIKKETRHLSRVEAYGYVLAIEECLSALQTSERESA